MMPELQTPFSEQNLNIKDLLDHMFLLGIYKITIVMLVAQNIGVTLLKCFLLVMVNKSCLWNIIPIKKQSKMING